MANKIILEELLFDRLPGFCLDRIKYILSSENPSPTALAELANGLSKVGEYKKASKLYEQAGIRHEEVEKSIFSAYADHYYARAIECAEKTNETKSKRIKNLMAQRSRINEETANYTNDAFFYLQAGSWAKRAGNIEGAKTLYRRGSMSSNPYYSALCAEALGEYELACKVFERLSRNEWCCKYKLDNAIRCAEKIKRFDIALRFFELAESFEKGADYAKKHGFLEKAGEFIEKAKVRKLNDGL